MPEVVIVMDGSMYVARQTYLNADPRCIHSLELRYSSTCLLRIYSPVLVCTVSTLAHKPLGLIRTPPCLFTTASGYPEKTSRMSTLHGLSDRSSVLSKAITQAFAIGLLRTSTHWNHSTMTTLTQMRLHFP